LQSIIETKLKNLTLIIRNFQTTNVVAGLAPAIDIMIKKEKNLLASFAYLVAKNWF